MKKNEEYIVKCTNVSHRPKRYTVEKKDITADGESICPACGEYHPVTRVKKAG